MPESLCRRPCQLRCARSTLMVCGSAQPTFRSWLNLPGEVGQALVQVQGVPHQPARLAAAQSAHGGDQVEPGEQLVRPDGRQEHGELLGGPYRHRGPYPGCASTPRPDASSTPQRAACGLGELHVPGRVVRVWVPKMLSPYATCAYSWIRPPSQSLRRTRIPVTSTGGCARPAGGSCRSDRCGRCEL